MPRARSVIRWILLFLIIFEAGYLWQLGNGAGSYTDPASEADTIRSVAAYLKDGLASHYGLPRILYGGNDPKYAPLKVQIDETGLVPEHYRQGFPLELATPDQWPYTHYPPGPNLMLAVLARVFGFEHLWLLRIFPITIGIIALALLFKTITETLGARTAVSVALALGLVPTIPLTLPTLHYESYSVSLLFLQMVIFMRWFWQKKVTVASTAFLFLLGFLQGWLSFDFCFLISLLVLPFWLLKRAEGQTPPIAWLLLGVAVPAVGFVVAHLLHLLQVAAELGGMSAALAEFRNTAAERGGLSEGGYFTHLSRAIYMTLRNAFSPKNLSFGPFLLLILVAVAPAALLAGFRWTIVRFGEAFQYHGVIEWPGSRRILPVLGAALLVSTIWIALMPQHTAGNAHLTVRHLLVLYVFCAIIVGASLRFGRGEGSTQVTLK